MLEHAISLTKFSTTLTSTTLTFGSTRGLVARLMKRASSWMSLAWLKVAAVCVDVRGRAVIYH